MRRVGVVRTWSAGLVVTRILVSGAVRVGAKVNGVSGGRRRRIDDLCSICGDTIEGEDARGRDGDGDHFDGHRA